MSLQSSLELSKCLLTTIWMSVGHLKYGMSKSEFLISKKSCTSHNLAYVKIATSSFQFLRPKVLVSSFTPLPFFPMYNPSANSIGSTIKICLESGCFFSLPLLPWCFKQPLCYPCVIELTT